jgi:hypothetical protein
LVRGSDSGLIRAELRATFAAYNAELERCAPKQRSARETAIAAASLYADILRTHLIFGVPSRRRRAPLSRTVDFQGALTEHDEALGWTLRTARFIPPLSS